jgi:hypothetical protein
VPGCGLRRLVPVLMHLFHLRTHAPVSKPIQHSRPPSNSLQLVIEVIYDTAVALHKAYGRTQCNGTAQAQQQASCICCSVKNITTKIFGEIIEVCNGTKPEQVNPPSQTELQRATNQGPLRWENPPAVGTGAWAILITLYRVSDRHTSCQLQHTCQATIRQSQIRRPKLTAPCLLAIRDKAYSLQFNCSKCAHSSTTLPPVRQAQLRPNLTFNKHAAAL